MFFKKIIIENFRLFKSLELADLNIPDRKTPGSGLNILIGENATGKTTVLEAINYLGMSPVFSKERLDITDFNNPTQPIQIIGESHGTMICKSSIEFYKKYRFECQGLIFKAQCRKIKEKNKLLSSQFATKLLFWTPSNGLPYYMTSDGKIISSKKGESKGQPKKIDDRDLIFENTRIEGGGINIFYFDKNRSRQLKKGQFKTTFQKIIEDITWRYRKNFINNTGQNELYKAINTINDEILKLFDTKNSQLSNDLANFLDHEDLKRVRLDVIKLLDPFKNSFFSLPLEQSNQQLSLSKLGSGIEMIATLLLLRNISDKAKGSIIYLIDEPELHLHPKAQFMLERLLLEESKDKQIFISTHSPHIFKNSTNKARIFIFKKGKNTPNVIPKVQSSFRSRYRWPSWGEINWYAFNMPTIEFFNELYGELFIKYANSIKTSSRKISTDEFDEYLKQKLQIVENNLLTWKEVKPNQQVKPKRLTFITYLRHYIHHPENSENKLSPKEFENYLKDAIISMLKLMRESSD